MKLRIFIIDDEKSIRNSFRVYLKLQGHEVRTSSKPTLCNVYHGRNCEKDAACADVLFIDYNLPGMSGLELLEKMEKGGCKAHPKNKILFSGDTSRIDRKRSELIGCQVRQKPLSFTQVDEIIAEANTRIDPHRKLATLN